MKSNNDIILASGSPRRKELLARAGYEFSIVVSDADESVPAGLDPEQVARHLARAKASAVAAITDAGHTVIGADTIVVLDGRIFGKPESDEDAFQMLSELSGRAHEVITGVCIVDGSFVDTFSETTEVVFRSLSDDEIRDYIATGEPADKAGAYGIQGLGGRLVDHIEGDYDNVVGLPVVALVEHLRTRGSDRPGTSRP